jgi:membrane-bound ClpP family serine protease
LIGRAGKTLGPLRPGGTIEIDGKEWEAPSLRGWIERGHSVEVVQYENNILLVKPASAVKADT